MTTQPVEVQLPDGRVVEFPAGTSKEVMERALQNLALKELGKDTLDTAQIAGAGVVKGASNAMNPALVGAGLARLGQGVLRTIPGMRSVSQMTDKPAEEAARGLEAFAPSTQGADIALRMPGVSNLAQVMKRAGVDIASAPRTPDEAYSRTGAQPTTLRNVLANVGEGVGGALPFAGMGVGTTLGYGAISGLGAGIGEEAAGPTGKVIGAMLPLAVAPMVSAGQYAARVTQPLRTSGQRAIAERVVRESAENPAKALANVGQRQPLPNAGMTGAEMTGDRGLISLQRAYQSRPGAVVGGEYTGANIPDAFLASRSQQNSALVKAMSRLGARSSADDASVALATKMREGLHQPVLQSETRAWEAFRKASGNQVFDADPLHAAWNALRRQPNIRPDRDLVPAREYKKLQAIFERGATDLDEIQSIRSGLMDASRRAAMAGERNQARVIDAHRRVLDDYINNLPVKDPATLDLYQTARTLTRAKKTAFEDSRIGSVFERTGQKYDLEATRVADQAFRNRESLDDAIRLAKANPEIMTELRRNFTTRLLERARTTRTDIGGDRVLTRAGLQKFLDDPVNQYAREQLFNSEAGRRVWGRIDRMLRRMDMTDAAKPRVGSNTAYDLQRGTVLDGLLLRLTGNLTGGVGSAVVNRLTQALFKSSIQEIDGMVAAILLNPRATELALKSATPENLQRLRSIAFPSPVLGALVGAAGGVRTSQPE